MYNEIFVVFYICPYMREHEPVIEAHSEESVL